MPVLDAYTLRARAIPVFVVCLPALVLLGGGVIEGAQLGIATGLTVTVFGALAGQLGRDRGKALEPELWTSWGGSPTQRALAHRSPELADPEAANRETRRLIGLTRDRERFPLVLAENINYGQRRNLLGLRDAGIAVSVITMIVAAILLAFGAGDLGTRAAHFGPGAAASLLAVAFWLFVVTPGWVRVPAEAYAERLLEAADALEESPVTGSPRC
jgi:hypothetical protein